MAGAGGAARVARRLAAMVRRGMRITLREASPIPSFGATQPMQDQAQPDVAATLPLAAPQGAARSPRRAVRPAAARRPSGKPGRPPGIAPRSRCIPVPVALPCHRMAGRIAFHPITRAAMAAVSRS